MFGYDWIKSPRYMKLKLLIKKLFELEETLSWKESIQVHNREEWIEGMSEALLEEALTFPCSTRPTNATGERVVGFWDAALPGFVANVYLQWHVKCELDDQCSIVHGMIDTVQPAGFLL